MQNNGHPILTSSLDEDGRLLTPFVRTEQIEPAPPPSSLVGPVAWMREHLFGGLFNTTATILIVLGLLWVVPPFIDYIWTDAAFIGKDREACIFNEAHPVVGACWAFIRDRFSFFIYGSYPVSERWRVDIFFVILSISIVWMMKLSLPRRDLGAVFAFIIAPVVSYFLLSGSPALGLPVVTTNLWGGLMVTVVVSCVGIVFSLPIGVLLALGRRSKMPAAQIFCVAFIEFVRGVPLITVLFMASVMLPLFVPREFEPDKLLRALVGVAMFASAYMAEVVRAGLQALPKGQYEGAMALGLSYGQMMRLIILPQALKVTIPNIVSTTIGLFKDTTLVVIVGIFDFLRTIETARIDPIWAAPTVSGTGYVFAAIFYFIFCYAMSTYARKVEERLAVADKR
jgi:general L-amino acid transport system permease protein